MSTTIQGKAENLILSIQNQIQEKTWVELRGQYDRDCIWKVQDTQAAAKEIAISTVKNEMQAVKDCFIFYTELERFEGHTIHKHYEDLLAALAAFEPKSDKLEK